MPRKSTGTVRILRNDDGEPAWHAKWTRANGERSDWEPISDPIAVESCCSTTTPECEHRHQAKAYAARLAPRVRAASAGQPLIETVAQYADRWGKWRKARGLACVGGDRVLLDRHILPKIGRFDVRTIQRDDLKRLVTSLDAKVAEGKSEDGKPFSWKTVVNAWGVARALFRDVQRAKDVSLCVRPDNPADGIAGPDVGAKKAKTYLWPSEFAALVASERVPMRWGRLFALAGYTYARAGELGALRWDDVDLEHDTIHVHQSVDRMRKRGVKATKSETARRIPIEPALKPLLAAMHRQAGGKGHVFTMPSVGRRSHKLKFYLRRAGVDRPDLFASDATRKAITFHDLRATGITWMAARGDDPLRIMQRAGHEDFETTKIYLREAENLSKGFGEVFPALPERLMGIVPKSPGAIRGPLSGGNADVSRGADGNRIRLRNWTKTERARGLGRELAEIARRVVAVRFRRIPSDSVAWSRVTAT